jgi:sulfur-oxidizing protein SoxZ
MAALDKAEAPRGFTPAPRVQVPHKAAKGEVFAIKALIAHQMETGLRRDSDGNVIPRKIINKFECTYNGAVVLSVDLFEAVAANPYIEFYVRATVSGQLEFTWQEDGGAVFGLQHDLTVV